MFLERQGKYGVSSVGMESELPPSTVECKKGFVEVRVPRLLVLPPRNNSTTAETAVKVKWKDAYKKYIGSLGTEGTR